MQDTSPRLKGTKAIELPVVRRFNTCASKEISWGGAFLLFFSASRDTEEALKKLCVGSISSLHVSGRCWGVNR